MASSTRAAGALDLGRCLHAFMHHCMLMTMQVSWSITMTGLQALRSNDRIACEDAAFAELLWRASGLQRIFEQLPLEGLTAVGLNENIRVYRRAVAMRGSPLGLCELTAHLAQISAWAALRSAF